MQLRKPLTLEEVLYALGISADTLQRLIDLGMFPDALFITERTKGWLWKDVDSYLHLRGRIAGKAPKTGGKDTG